MRGRNRGQGRVVTAPVEGREPGMGLRQGPQADKSPELVPFDSPAATPSRKRSAADFVAAGDDDTEQTAPPPKVFRLQAFGGGTAHAIGRMQLFQTQLAAQGNAEGADLEMAMLDGDSDDRSSNDAAATLMGMGNLHVLQRRDTVAARGGPNTPLQA
ncbi:hypothetical protein WJX77_007598 [Trebouxia sp. C0004]